MEPKKYIRYIRGHYFKLALNYKQIQHFGGSNRDTKYLSKYSRLKDHVNTKVRYVSQNTDTFYKICHGDLDHLV